MFSPFGAASVAVSVSSDVSEVSELEMAVIPLFAKADAELSKEKLATLSSAAIFSASLTETGVREKLPGSGRPPDSVSVDSVCY